MSEIKLLNKFSFILLFFLQFINFKLIKSQSLCPFQKDEELLIYYSKGVNQDQPEYFKYPDYKNYTWKFIHCINGYSTSTYIIKENGEEFYKKSGIFIGSSIDLGKLTKEFIETNLSSLEQDLKEKLISLCGKFGEDAELIYNTTGNFTLNNKTINDINNAVYSFYYSQMQNYYGIEKIKSHNLEMCLLTFYAKFYQLDSYLEDSKTHVINEHLYMLAYYFLNIKNDNYIQNKLWTLLALSSAPIEYNYQHICFYLDSRINEINDRIDLKKWIKNFASIPQNQKNLYSLGNFTQIITDEKNSDSVIFNYTTFSRLLDNYRFNKLPIEDINWGIKKLESIMEYNNNLFDGKYYQRHLVIILNSIQYSKINIENFEKKGIHVILLFKITDEENYIKIDNIFDRYNRIPFYSYTNITKDNNLTLILNSLINFNIEPFKYNNLPIEINRIRTIKRDNIQCFKIIYDNIFKNNNITDNNITDNYNLSYYFHISLIYNNAKEIKERFNNNPNIVFFVSKDYPYTDIRKYELINFCFNTTVSSNYNNSPYINYLIPEPEENSNENYFYITIVANDLDYSLKIELLNETNMDNFNKSNGLFGNLHVQPISSEFIATFSEERCIKKMCKIDYFSLAKYFSSGIHLKNVNSDNLFDKFFDMNMYECIYKSYFCPFFNADQKESLFKQGPFIGHGIDLSELDENTLFKESIPLYVINKLFPFLLNSLDHNLAKDVLEKYNLILTYEELLQLNINYLRAIFQETERIKYFNEFKENIQIALFLRATELGGIKDIKCLEELHQEDTDTYLEELMKSEKNRKTSFESLNFQMLLIQSTKINKLKKCLLSFVVGKSLLYSEAFIELINKFSDYRISLSYYDEKKKETVLVQYFTENIETIKKNIYSITKNSTSVPKTKKNVNINSILEQQYSLFENFDYGIKKSIIIVSTHSNETFNYEFNDPKEKWLKKLYESCINIFDYSDRINFITKNNNKTGEQDKNIYDFYNSEQSEYIQYVPYLEYNDMSNNYVTLFNIINKYPIPINKIEDIYLDLHPHEEIIFEFNLTKEISKLRNKNFLDKYNQLKFTFEPSSLDIFFSRNFPFPNSHSFDINSSFENEHGNTKIIYDLKNVFDDYNNSKFYMSIKSSKKVDDLYVDLELCDEDGECLRQSFYFKFYIAFICVGILIFIYGLYICFCETTFKKESNIFDIK